MTKRILMLAVLTTVLLFAERWLARADLATRAAQSRVGRLISAEERAELPIAAVRVEARDGPPHLFARMKGLWRCLTYREAPADAAAIQRLVDELLESEGVVVSDAVDEAPLYGITTPDTIRVALCGPQVLEDPSGDVRVAFDLGARVPGREGIFVRRLGSKEIWSIDADPRTEAETRLRPELPPLLDSSVLPQSWNGWSTGGPTRVFVDFADGAGYELQRRAVEISPEELRAGEVPWVWMLDPGPGEARAAKLPATAFTLFLQRVPFADVLAAEERAQRGLDSPTATVTVAAAEGAPLQVEVGPPGPDGVPLWVPATETLYLVTREVADLIAPRRAHFVGESDHNPWDPYLHSGPR